MILINSKLKVTESFSLNKKSNSDMDEEIKLLNVKEATTFKKHATNSFKIQCTQLLSNLFNDTMNNSECPDE